MLTADIIEPAQLLRGKRFQKIVQDDFSMNSQDGVFQSEAYLSLKGLQNAGQQYGRADLLITELGGFVTLLEIKATNWDKIQPANIKKNLWRQQRQLFKYVDKFVELDKLDVCLGIIYPKPPRSAALRDEIESCLTEYGIPAYWYNDIKTVHPISKETSDKFTKGNRTP